MRARLHGGGLTKRKARGEGVGVLLVLLGGHCDLVILVDCRMVGVVVGRSRKISDRSVCDAVNFFWIFDPLGRFSPLSDAQTPVSAVSKGRHPKVPLLRQSADWSALHGYHIL
jgi:hypothetical protein